MNRVAWLGAGAWVVLGVGALSMALAPARGWAGDDGRPAEPARAESARPRYAIDALGRDIIARDPFRFGRRPAVTPYDPARGTAPPPVAPAGPPPPPKPVLSLVGVLGGDVPQAILEGLPGSTGARAVRVGDVVGGLSVMTIRGDTVRVAGMDTVWVLTVREPWKRN